MNLLALLAMLLSWLVPHTATLPQSLAVQQAPQATLVEQNGDLVLTVTGLTAGDSYQAGYIVDQVGCVGTNAQVVRGDGSITFYVGEDQIDFSTRADGWSHVDAKLQSPGASCSDAGVIGASFDRGLAQV